MVREIKKASVAALARDRGYTDRLALGRSSENAQISEACRYFLLWLTDPDWGIVDIDAESWQKGRMVLVGSGLFSAAECDEIEGLYKSVPQWTFKEFVPQNDEEKLAVFVCADGTEQSIIVNANALDVTPLLNRLNAGA